MPPEKKQSSADWLDIVRQNVQSLRFGVVQIVVHESRVTQIERTEKTRLPNERRSRQLNKSTDQTTGGIAPK
jgi:hypothetical protein